VSRISVLSFPFLSFPFRRTYYMNLYRTRALNFIIETCPHTITLNSEMRRKISVWLSCYPAGEATRSDLQFRTQRSSSLLPRYHNESPYREFVRLYLPAGALTKQVKVDIYSNKTKKTTLLGHTHLPMLIHHHTSCLLKLNLLSSVPITKHYPIFRVQKRISRSHTLSLKAQNRRRF
jgi:hypothetical protein